MVPGSIPGGPTNVLIALCKPRLLREPFLRPRVQSFQEPSRRMHMFPRRWLPVLLITIVFQSLTASSERGEQTAIIGRVMEEIDSSGLPGVPIRLASEGWPELEIVATTDIRGMYAIRGLRPAADYVITFDSPGFVPVIVGPVEISEGGTARIDVSLRSTALET